METFLQCLGLATVILAIGMAFGIVGFGVTFRDK